MNHIIHEALRERVELETVNQFIRFCVVGVSNVAVSFVVFYVFYNYAEPSEKLSALLNTHFKMDGAIANIVGYLAGMINSFILNKIWTFKAKAGTFKQAYRFTILNIICLILSTAILYIFVDLLLFPYILVWFASIIIVMTLNFLGNKYWTFSEQSGNAP